MPGFPRPFASEDAADGTFDEYDEFRPDHLPEPGPFLDGADVLTGEDHVAFHRLTREIFEERGVYDATFGYNLARLNLDTRHPDAGWRYALAPDAESNDGDPGDSPASDDSAIPDDPADAGDSADPNVLLAEFTPTTEFCPQSDTLTVGAFRAWNGLDDRHEYDRVAVAVAPMHHQSVSINERLRNLERGLLDAEDAGVGAESPTTAERGDDLGSGDDSRVPF